MCGLRELAGQVFAGQTGRFGCCRDRLDVTTHHRVDRGAYLSRNRLRFLRPIGGRGE